MLHLLDNIVWHALTGAQAHFAVGEGAARRYAPGFSPIIGFADNTNADLATIARYCKAGEQFYTDGWSGPVPTGWNLMVESTMDKMVWKGALPDEDDALSAVPLGPEHAQEALDLATLTRPGPFGLRTLELGDYFGIFEGARLIAMAGERMAAGPWREISGVCAHPDAQGRGYARRLMLKLLRRQMLRGESTFLHVVSTNLTARNLYIRMGFETYKVSQVRVITPISRSC
ncbi:MAG: GNAT family N-acetyltransferase [Betaproteobacteria bacterium]|nr:GNAT family N-acetyltransferase [Betaproteobacteria bacterium]